VSAFGSSIVPGRDDLDRADLSRHPPLSRPLVDEGVEKRSQRLARFPQLVVRDIEHAIDHARIVVTLEPVGPEVPLQQRAHLRRHPRRHVHAVGDERHRQVLVADARPDRLPHPLGHLAVQLTDAVHRTARAQGERRHVEQRSRAVVVMTEREELFAMTAEIAPRAGQMRLDEREWKRVVTRRDGRVRGEDGRAPDLLERRVELPSLLAQVANPLQHDERGVSLR
jgi:hypothetical protein